MEYVFYVPDFDQFVVCQTSVQVDYDVPYVLTSGPIDLEAYLVGAL